MTETRSLHRKLAQVMYEAERIPKNGTAPREMGGYRFVQVGDAADFIRKALAEKVITMMPTKVTVVGIETGSPRSDPRGMAAMSRLRVGLRPQDWQEEGPSTARLVRHGGGPVTESRAVQAVSEARRAQLAEAQRRLREREAAQ